MLTGNIFETTGMPNCAGTATVTRLEIERMGLWVADLLSDQQLAAAAERYNAKVALNKQFLLSLHALRLVWMNHFHKVIRMPAGGALGGGSMQTGFEMELTTLPAVEALMEGWPNRQEMGRGGLSWEVCARCPHVLPLVLPHVISHRSPPPPLGGRQWRGWGPCGPWFWPMWDP